MAEQDGDIDSDYYAHPFGQANTIQMQYPEAGAFQEWRAELKYAALCATLVLLSIFISSRLEGPANPVSVMRFGSAIVLGVLFQRGGRSWALHLIFLAVAVFLANMLADRTAGFAVAAAGIRALEVGAAFAILRALGIDPVGLRDTRALAYMGAVAVALLPLACGVVGGLVVDHFYRTGWATAALNWSLGSAMGMLVLLPVILAWSPHRWRRLCHAAKMQEFLLLLAISLVATLLATEFSLRPFIVMSLPLTLVALRTPLLGTAMVCAANIVLLTLLKSRIFDTWLPWLAASPMEALSYAELNVYSALVVIAPLTIGVLLVERARGQHQLAASRRQLEAVTNNVPALIGYLDSDRRYRLVNRVYQDWFGQTPAAMIGKTPEEVLGPDAAEDVAPHLDQAMGGETVCFERTIPGGRQVESTLVPDLEDGQLRGIFLMSSDITARKLLEARLQEGIEHARNLADHDELTGLPNRRSLGLRLDRALADAKANGQPMALMFMDLDAFKPINDQLGHDTGDRLLRLVADRLKASVRTTDIVARVGGDEFVVVLSPIGTITDAKDIANKLLQSIRLPFYVDGHELKVSLTIGIAMYPQDGNDAAKLMRRADAAMYRAKSLGRNRFS